MERIMVEDLVSVVIPVRNREKTIQRAIDSVLRQTYSNIELIVIDDGSTDNTVEKIRLYQDRRIRLICLKEHRGANKARNIGIADAKGDYIAFQDSDDEWIPEKLVTQISYMKRNMFDACYSAYFRHIGDETEIIPLEYKNREKYEKNIKEVLKQGNSIGTPTLVIHKNVLVKMNGEGFDEKLPRLQDYDFAIRIAKCVAIGYIDIPLVHAYRSDNSISNNYDLLYKAIPKLMKKHADFIDVKSLFSVILDSSAYHDNPDKVLENLEKIQESIAADQLNCRDELIIFLIKEVRKHYHMLIRQYDSVIKHIGDREYAIYGAGEIGKAIYRQLLGRGVRPNCFLVTVKGETEYIDDIPVCSLDEYHDRKNMIIIGVREELRNELVDNLVEKGFMSFCVYQKKK